MNRMLKPAVLSLSCLTIMAGAAISPGLARIAAAFPDSPLTVIKLVLTLPALFMIPASLITGRLASRYSRRRLLLIGLGCYVTGGAAGGFAPALGVLLACRALLGVAVGMIMPLSTGLIADFFSGEERTRTMGQSAAASNLGGIVATLLTGMLAAIGWRYMFAVYVLALGPLFMVWRHLPEPPRSRIRGPNSGRLPWRVWAWAVAAGTVMLAFYCLPVNLALHLRDNDLGGPRLVGLAIAVSTGCGFLAGMTLAPVRRQLGRAMPAVFLGGFALGFLIMARAASPTQVLLAQVVTGLSWGGLLPNVYLAATAAGGDQRGVQVMAVVSGAIYLGQFLSPVVLGAGGRLFGVATTRGSFTMVSAAVAVVAAVSLLNGLRPRSS